MTSTDMEFDSALIGTCNKQEEGKASDSPAMMEYVDTASNVTSHCDRSACLTVTWGGAEIHDHDNDSRAT
jgi:hypothetical protein